MVPCYARIYAGNVRFFVLFYPWPADSISHLVSQSVSKWVIFFDRSWGGWLEESSKKYFTDRSRIMNHTLLHESTKKRNKKWYIFVQFFVLFSNFSFFFHSFPFVLFFVILSLFWLGGYILVICWFMNPTSWICGGKTWKKLFLQFFAGFTVFCGFFRVFFAIFSQFWEARK